MKNILDPDQPAAVPGDPAGPAGGLDALAKPLAAFLNPETGQATAVKPDPAGWPKAEVSPGLPFAEAGGAPDPIAKALDQAAAAAEAPTAGPAMPELEHPDLPGLEAPKPKVQAPGLQPVQLNNPETGELTKIAPDDAGWPKAEVSPGLPDGLPEALPEAPKLPGTDVLGKDPLAGKAPKAPDLGLEGPAPKAPKADLPGAPKSTRITGLETGDLTTITPDSAGWPKASVQPGGPPKLPDGLPEQIAQDPPGKIKPPDLLDKLKDQV